MGFIIALFCGGFLGILFLSVILGQDLISNFIYFLDHSFFMAVFELSLLFSIIVMLKNTFDRYGRRDMKELITIINNSRRRKTLIDDWYGYSTTVRASLLKNRKEK